MLDARLKYKVIDTQVVEPDQVESLGIQADKDLVTLVTCYPIGINSHRLLVTGSAQRTKKKRQRKKSSGTNTAMISGYF